MRRELTCTRPTTFGRADAAMTSPRAELNVKPGQSPAARRTRCGQRSLPGQPLIAKLSRYPRTNRPFTEGRAPWNAVGRRQSRDRSPAVQLRTPGLLLAAFVALGSAVAAESEELQSTLLAQAFGSAPLMWGLQLSPDGAKFSAIQMNPSGVTFARVVSFEDATSAIVLTGTDEFRVTWCGWANQERLLCGLRGLVRFLNSGHYFPVTRLVSTHFDGSEVKYLVNDRLEDVRIAQYQDRVVDWLPDEDDHVLVQEPGDGGEGVSRLNVYTGSLTPAERPRRNARIWLTDGHGTARLYFSLGDRDRHWMMREASISPWNLLHSVNVEDFTDSFAPIGFAESRTELLFFDRYEGRKALFATGSDASSIRILRSIWPTFIGLANTSVWSPPPTSTTDRVCTSSTRVSRPYTMRWPRRFPARLSRSSMKAGISVTTLYS